MEQTTFNTRRLTITSDIATLHIANISQIASVIEEHGENINH